MTIADSHPSSGRRGPPSRHARTRVLTVGLAVPAALLTYGAAPPAPAVAVADPPSIVMILTDDLSMNLLPYMDEVARLADDGVSFDRFFVSNSLCCPSRATLQTGQYPHNSGVVSNFWPTGGFGRFMAEGHLDSSVGTYLQAAGYRTGLFGKYLNGYSILGDDDGSGAPDYEARYVPPGWDEWSVSQEGYVEFGYTTLRSIDGSSTVVRSGTAPEDYLTDRMADEMTGFVDRAHGQPFFLMLAPFAAHASIGRKYDPQQPDAYLFPPAPRDRSASPNRPETWGPAEFRYGDCGAPVDGGCRDVTYPEPGWENFNVPAADAPLGFPTEPLPPEEIDEASQEFLERVQMVQSVDDMVGAVRSKLEAAGLADTTYIVFTSDNGFHLGEHAMRFGKTTAFDHDAQVPFIVLPPEGGDGARRLQVASNVDILPTLLDVAQAPVPAAVDGESLLDLVRGAAPPRRRGVLIEHEAAARKMPFERDPDLTRRTDDAPRYVAVRTDDYLYVDYSELDASPPEPDRGELYWLAEDPDQTDNRWADLGRDDQAALNSYLRAYASCAGASCRSMSWEAPVLTP